MDASIPVAAPLPPPSVPTGKLPGAGKDSTLWDPITGCLFFHHLGILMILGRALLIPLVENCIQEIKVAVEKGHAELKNRKSRTTLKSNFLPTHFRPIDP
jgi:hypothetical protein